MTLQLRINQLFDDHPDKKASHLAKYLGISRAAISDWRNGNTKEMNGKYAYGVARFFGNISPEWVQSGKGVKYLKNDYIDGEAIKNNIYELDHKLNENNLSIVAKIGGDSQLVKKPTIRLEDAALWADIKTRHLVEVIEMTEANKVVDFVCVVTDDSMENKVMRGDLLECFYASTVTVGKRAIVRTPQGSCILRMAYLDGDETKLMALKPGYEVRKLEDCTPIAKVRAILHEQ